MKLRVAVLAGLAGLAVAAAPVGATAARAAVAIEPPPGLAGFEQLTLASGLRVLVGTPARAVPFTEALLLVAAGTSSQTTGSEHGAEGQEAGAPGRSRGEAARVAAEAFLGGSLPGEEQSVRQQLARAGVTLDYTVGREVAVFRFAMPTRHAAAVLHLVAALMRRENVEPAVWQAALASRRQVAAAEEADTWQRSLDTLDGLLWHQAEAEPLADLELADLETFRRAAYAPERMVLCLWGDRPTGELAALVRQELDSPFGRPPLPALHSGAEPALAPAGGVRCLRDEGAEPPVLLVGLGTELPDDLSFYGWQLMAHVLGSSHMSRLHERLRVREPFVYTVEASCVPVGSDGLTLRIATQTPELLRAREVILEEVRRLVREEVPQKELDVARAIFKSRLLLDQGSFRDQFYRRGLQLLSPKPPRDLARAAAALDSLTPASLLAVLRRTLEPATATTVIVSAKAEALCGPESTPQESHLQGDAP